MVNKLDCTILFTVEHSCCMIHAKYAENNCRRISNRPRRHGLIVINNYILKYTLKHSFYTSLEAYLPIERDSLLQTIVLFIVISIRISLNKVNLLY